MLFFFFFYVYVFTLKETENTWVGEGQRERERGRIPSRLCTRSVNRAWCLSQIHKTVKSWPEPKSRVGRSTNWATKRPQCFFFFFLSLFILREREREQGRGRETETEIIPSKLCTGSTEPDDGVELKNREIMTWTKTKNWTLNRLSHPGGPKGLIF